MIASGTFRSKAAGPLEFVKSPDKGTPGVKVIVQFKEGPDAGSTLEWIGWLSDKTTARTGESLGYMGYDGSDPASVMRNEFISVVEHEEYTKTDGSVAKRPRIQWINDPNGAGGRMVPMSATEVVGAQDRLKAAMLAAKAKAAAPVNEEDIPRF